MYPYRYEPPIQYPARLPRVVYRNTFTAANVRASKPHATGAQVSFWKTDKPARFLWTPERIERVVKLLSLRTSDGAETLHRTKVAVGGIRTTFDPNEEPEGFDGFGWVGTAEVYVRELGQLPCSLKFVVVEGFSSNDVGWIESVHDTSENPTFPAGLDLTIRIRRMDYNPLVTAFTQHRNALVVPMLNCMVHQPTTTKDRFSLKIRSWSLETWPHAQDDVYNHPYRKIEVEW